MSTRLDQFLVDKGWFESRAKASAAIKAGLVCVNGLTAQKAASKVSDSCQIEAQPEHPWVSRAGLKLDHAIAQFNIEVTQRFCLDVGASTGGFSQVLLSHGAAKVYAVDVGQNQLHADLRYNPRVVSMEKTDARTLQPDQFDPLPDLLVCDASFISATKVLAKPMSLMSAGSDMLTLVKPQFEVGRENIGKGGVVRDAVIALQALRDIESWVHTQGWEVRQSDTSPVTGGDGNTEFLLHATKVHADKVHTEKLNAIKK